MGEPVVKITAYVPVSRALLADAEHMRGAIDEAFDRLNNPWKYSDRPRWPDTFVLVPWLHRLNTWWANRHAELDDEWEDD